MRKGNAPVTGRGKSKVGTCNYTAYIPAFIRALPRLLASASPDLIVLIICAFTMLAMLLWGALA